MNRNERRKQLQFIYEMVVAPAKERWDTVMIHADKNPWLSVEYLTFLEAKKMMADCSGNEKQQDWLRKELEHIAFLRYLNNKAENENA